MAEVPLRIVSVITTAAVDSDFWATHDGILYVVHGTIEPFTVQFRPGFETHFEDNGKSLRRKKKEILKLLNGDELKEAFSYAVTQRMAPAGQLGHGALRSCQGGRGGNEGRIPRCWLGHS